MDSWDSVPEAARQLRYHGGNINAARQLFPDAPEPWIDLSTGINPVPYPVGPIAPEAWSRLPEPAAQAALEANAGAAYGVHPAAEVVAAPGTQALIQWLPRLFPARRVGILGTTYSEHETCWRSASANVTVVPALPDLTAFDVAVVVNPNNPDGRTCRPDDLADIASSLSKRGGLLVVDEAFMDVLDTSNSFAPKLPDTGAVVLRSFGKMYGLAGLRLGFAIASPESGRVIRGAIGPWAVSGPAIEIGRRALADTRWRNDSIRRLNRAADDLDRLLRSAGFDLLGGTCLFRLAQHPRAGVWFERLCRAGILTRPFRTQPDWLRFGIPGSRVAWGRLQSVLVDGSVSRA